MNAFVRQIAALSVLWAMCELLLPDGRQQQMVRLTASLLVMAALLTTLGGWLGAEVPAQQTISFRVQASAQDAYRRTALSAMANQAETLCVRMAQNAGYQARAAVYVTMDGAVDHIDLALTAVSPLITPEELTAYLAQQFQTDDIRLEGL